MCPLRERRPNWASSWRGSLLLLLVGALGGSLPVGSLGITFSSLRGGHQQRQYRQPGVTPEPSTAPPATVPPPVQTSPPPPPPPVTSPPPPAVPPPAAPPAGVPTAPQAPRQQPAAPPPPAGAAPAAAGVVPTAAARRLPAPAPALPAAAGAVPLGTTTPLPSAAAPMTTTPSPQLAGTTTQGPGTTTLPSLLLGSTTPGPGAAAPGTGTAAATNGGVAGAAAEWLRKYEQTVAQIIGSSEAYREAWSMPAPSPAPPPSPPPPPEPVPTTPMPTLPPAPPPAPVDNSKLKQRLAKAEQMNQELERRLGKAEEEVTELRDSERRVQEFQVDTLRKRQDVSAQITGLQAQLSKLLNQPEPAEVNSTDLKRQLSEPLASEIRRLAQQSRSSDEAIAAQLAQDRRQADEELAAQMGQLTQQVSAWAAAQTQQKAQFQQELAAANQSLWNEMLPDLRSELGVLVANRLQNAENNMDFKLGQAVRGLQAATQGTAAQLNARVDDMAANVHRNTVRLNQTFNQKMDKAVEEASQIGQEAQQRAITQVSGDIVFEVYKIKRLQQKIFKNQKKLMADQARMEEENAGNFSSLNSQNDFFRADMQNLRAETAGMEKELKEELQKLDKQVNGVADTFATGDLFEYQPPQPDPYAFSSVGRLDKSADVPVPGRKRKDLSKAVRKEVRREAKRK